MRTEAIIWRELPEDGMPDAEITVQTETLYPEGQTEVWPAWWSGEHWIEASTGDRLERGGIRVIAWSDMPAGSRAC